MGEPEITWRRHRRGRYVLPFVRDNFIGDLTVRLLDTLQTEFGEKLCVVLDNLPYFAVNKVQGFVEGPLLELCYLPRSSTLMNPAEECWHQLNQRLGNQLFDNLDELQDAALAALASIEPLNIFIYLCR